MNTNKSVRWLYLVVGTAALLFAGIIYGWSILKAPLAAEFGWSASALTLNFTLTMCFFCFGGMLGGALTKKFGLKVSCITAAVLSCAGFLLTGALSGSIVLLYLSYGVLAGLGIGVTYNAIISTVNAWFPDKKGLCSGILMMGFGSSALVLGKVAAAIINNPAMGWRVSFRVLGICLGVIILFAGLVLKRPEAAAAVKSTGSSEVKSYTSAEMLKSVNFYKAFVLVVFLAAVGSTVISMAKDIALSVGTAEATAVTLVGVLSLCNGLGRIITGAVFDKFGRRTTMLGANIIAICAAGITLVAILTNSPVLCIVGLGLTGLSYGACPTISSAYIAESFGPAHFASNFSIMNFNILFASFIATGASMIREATNGFAGAFVLLLCLSVVAMLLNLSLKNN